MGQMQTLNMETLLARHLSQTTILGWAEDMWTLKMDMKINLEDIFKTL